MEASVLQQRATREGGASVYRGYRLVPGHGRVYAVPGHLSFGEVVRPNVPPTHPAVLSAAGWDELEALIDQRCERPEPEQAAGEWEGYRLVRFGGACHAVPAGAGEVDLALAEDRRRAGVVSGESPDEVRARIAAARDSCPVEFAGWLPVYEFSGNCGRHPQFNHTATPPPGYRFTSHAPRVQLGPSPLARLGDRLARRLKSWSQGISKFTRPLWAVAGGGPGVGVRTRLRVLAAMLRLFVALRRAGGRLGPTLRFLQSRHFQSQLLIGQQPGLVFLTSMPYTYGQNPWVIEIEDPTTLFYPLIENGNTSRLRIRESPYYPIVRALLEADHCKGIFTHMRSTADMVGTLFASDTIRAKVHHLPLGVRLPRRWQRHEDSDEIHLLFINSWCQVPENFYVRGGLDVLEAFAILRERYPQLRLTLRTRLPALDPHYHRLIERGWVRVISRFLPAEEMESLLASSHVFLLPAARVHIMSLLQAMGHGLAVVGSDGWGFDEYLTHEHNGLVVRGRQGKVSWCDREEGLLREDYAPMQVPDREIIDGLVEAVSRLVEDAELRRRLARNARQDVATRFSLDNWNRGLKEGLDRARGCQAASRQGG